MRSDYQRTRSHRLRWLWGILIVIILIIFGGLYLVGHATSPLVHAQSAAVSKAKQSGVKPTSGFYWTNLNDVYYTVPGTKNKQSVYAIVPKSKQLKTTVVKQNSGLTRNDILKKVWSQQKPKKVLQAALGLFNGDPAWQVSYVNQSGKLCYVTYAFKTGETLQKIMNI
ncbi:hypothetical protein DCM90_01475 [Levilactobacillus bambusae]|uniref:Cell wall elongation regulator TseB-like domain-containing protein n=2 Tax=Levilactobacillus bambusae TaxID=2024736 RepID=A0A2V1N2C6_9LACO|nr:hypothetical protein DCM90_01475 [Levilactobacillus bambusae]